MADEGERIKTINLYKIPKTASTNRINDEIISPLTIIEKEQQNEVNSRFTNFTNNNNNNNNMKNPKKKKKTSEQKIFYGRDEAYPEELNELIQPLFCKLCETQLNSIKTAQAHYESKSHYKKVSNWLTEWSKTTGEPAPKISKIVNEEYSGSLHCKHCDLILNSIFDARQHYNGKKHKKVLSGIAKPSGSGYYDKNGNWVRTIVNVNTDERFGVGASFLPKPEVKEKPAKGVEDLKANENLFCELCNVRATSEDQMTMHKTGIKHLKKLKNSVTDIIQVDIPKKEKNQLDFSMYRTPSGSYYCKDCNTTINDPSTFNQHLSSKKHTKKVKEKPTGPTTKPEEKKCVQKV